MGRDAPPHLFHEREIRGPVLAGGSPDRNENRQAGFHSLSEIGGEGQPPFRQPFADQFGQRSEERRVGKESRASVSRDRAKRKSRRTENDEIEATWDRR